MIDAFGAEVMLLGWKITHNGGAEIRLLLADESDIEHFKAMTVAKGKVAGQILMAAFSEVSTDGTPKEKKPQTEAARDAWKKLGPLSQWAVLKCGDKVFNEWLASKFTGPWRKYAEDRNYSKDDVAKCVILQIMGIKSRKELDTNAEAAQRFHTLIRIPFADWVDSQQALG